MTPPAALALAVIAASGCAAVTTMQTARSLPAGKTQVVIGPELNGGGVREGNGKIAIPELASSLSVGVGHGVEVRGKAMVLPLGQALTSVAGEVSAKVALVSGERTELATGLGGGYRVLSSSGATWESVSVNLPLLVGINLRGGRDQLVLGPRVGWQRWYSTGARPVDVPQVGTTIGYAWAVRPTFTVMPELSWLYSPVEVNGMDGGTALFSFGIGFVFDR